MSSPATGSAVLDVQRLKYVTENFESVQGLNFAAVGLLFLIPAIDQEVPNLAPFFQRVHRAIGDADSRIDFVPLAGCIFLLGARFRRSLWLWRSDLILLTVGVLFYTFAVFAPLSHPQIAESAVWKFAVKYWLSLLYIATGLYDHCLLVRLLPRRTVEAQEI